MFLTGRQIRPFDSSTENAFFAPPPEGVGKTNA